MPARPHPLGWPNALHPSRSPCRIDAAKGSRQHRCSGMHADRVESYRSWRDSEYEAADAAAYGAPHSPGDEEYWVGRERPTFARFLRDMREHCDEEAAA